MGAQLADVLSAAGAEEADTSGLGSAGAGAGLGAGAAVASLGPAFQAASAGAQAAVLQATQAGPDMMQVGGC